MMVYNDGMNYYDYIGQQKKGGGADSVEKELKFYLAFL